MATDLAPAVKEALRLEGLHGAAEASRQTGVPRYAIVKWRNKLGLGGPDARGQGAQRVVAPKPRADAYLRFRIRELGDLQQRALDGCRCPRPFADPYDGLCVKCGHVWNWRQWREVMSAVEDPILLALCGYLRAGSAESDHARDLAKA